LVTRTADEVDTHLLQMQLNRNPARRALDRAQVINNDKHPNMV